jgi:hypothetical protein
MRSDARFCSTRCKDAYHNRARRPVDRGVTRVEPRSAPQTKPWAPSERNRRIDRRVRPSLSRAEAQAISNWLDYRGPAAFAPKPPDSPHVRDALHRALRDQRRRVTPTSRPPSPRPR